MLNHRRGAGGCSEGANDSRFRQRVWAGRSPAELVIKSSSWPMGWRQSSHRSTNVFPDVAGVSNCGGNHAEVLPKVIRQEGAPSATAATLDGLHSGFAQSSVFPKTTRHVQGDAAAAAITTSVARVKRNNPAALSLDRERSTPLAKWRKGGKSRAQYLQVVKGMEDARGKNPAGHWPCDESGDGLPRMEYPIG